MRPELTISITPGELERLLHHLIATGEERVEVTLCIEKTPDAKATLRS